MSIETEPATASVVKEFARARRNRAVVAWLVFGDPTYIRFRRDLRHLLGVREGYQALCVLHAYMNRPQGRRETRSGRTPQESIPRGTRDEKLRTLQGIAPWAVFGHSEEIEKAWRKNRAALASEVDKRCQMLADGGFGRQAS